MKTRSGKIYQIKINKKILPKRKNTKFEKYKQYKQYTKEDYNFTPLTVNIDFSYAKKQWRKNKKHIGNGVFEYK
jgi:hypothetical protein